MNRDAQIAFERAHRWLIFKQYFWGMLVSRLVIEQCASIGTACTDGVKLFYNPEWFMTLSEEVRRFVLAHEVCHCAYDHPGRRGDRDPSLWNIAVDYVVNAILKDCGFTLIDGCLYDKKYDGLSGEQVYERLLQERQQQQKKQEQEEQKQPSGGSNGSGTAQCSPDAENGDPEQDTDGSAGDSEPGEGEESEPGDGDADSDADEPEETDTDGSGSGDGDDEIDAPDPGGFGGVIDPPQGQESEVSAQWNCNVAQAAQQCVAEGGRLPGGVDRFVKELTETAVDYRDLLRSYLDTLAFNAFTEDPPNVRFQQAGFLMETLQSDEMGHVFVLCDRSGSISEEMARQSVSELSGLLTSFPDSTVHLWSHDTDVYFIGEFENAGDTDWTTVGFPGYGGTDFRPAYRAMHEYADEQGVEPKVIIHYTDLRGSWPDPSDVHVPVIVVDVLPGRGTRPCPITDEVVNCNRVRSF